MYGDDKISDRRMPAVIDTGSSQIALPTSLYDPLIKDWQKSIPDLDCAETFCKAKESCNNIQSKVKPVGFHLETHVFQLPPNEYLFDI